MVRVIRRSLLAALLASGFVSLTFAAEGAKHEKAPANKKDPVADAFVLPAHVALRADQQQDFDRMKSQYEPQLHSAVQKVESSTDTKEKTAAAKEVVKLRGEIKKAIHTILAKPDPNASKPVPQAGGNKPKKTNGKH